MFERVLIQRVLQGEAVYERLNIPFDFIFWFIHLENLLVSLIGANLNSFIHICEHVSLACCFASDLNSMYLIIDLALVEV